jgi:2-dehydro-3-deoxy-D-arabinonate dehydratase
MLIVRYLNELGEPTVGIEVEGHIRPLANAGTIGELLQGTMAEIRMTCDESAKLQGQARTDVRLLPPVDARMEVWAAGVTYRRSREARVQESEGAADFYQLVYEANRPELFFKSAAWRVTGDDEHVSIRRDSEINVPEPELALVINSRGETVGYTICNDVSSRSIEGANPLYLPQAKVYFGSCAVGPSIRPAWEVADPYNLRIEMSIHRQDALLWQGLANTSELHRKLSDLVGYLFREESFPDGVVLSTGTSLVPELPFTLVAGDFIQIRIDEIGTLKSHVSLGKDEMTWLAGGSRTP